FRGESPDLPPGSPADRVQSLYPRMFTIPDGNVLLAGPSWADSAKLNTATATDPSAPLGSAWTNYSTQPSIRHLGGPAVLEPDMSSFGGSWRALLLGGIPASDGLQLSLATRVVERMNADPAGTPGWEAPDPAEQLTKARYYHNDVLLPDGGMVVVGGGSGSDPTTYIGNYYIDPSDSTRDELRQVELRRPGEKTWRLGAAQEEWRTYHGTAALLPDGRILSAGDDYHEGPDPFNPLPDSTRRDSAEIYWPPYLFNGNTCAPRPVIRAVGATAPPAGANDPWAVTTYAEPFGIFSDHARSGMQAVLVAPAADTHAFDFTQRVIPLKVTSVVTGGGLNVLTPANAAIAQPGWYELYVIDADGTPSVGRWVRLLAPAGADANRDGPPITVTGTWPNPSPRSCVNPDGSTVTEGVTPPPPPPPPAPVPPAVTFTSKLTVKHISIRRSSRELDLLASITTRASGRVKVELVAGSHRATFHPTISSAKGRIQIKRKIPASLAARRTALVTITYLGDADTRPLSVRLLVGPHAAKLTMTAPKLTSGGRIKTNGTISRHARGSVRVQLEFELGETTKTVQLTARVSKGAWKLSKQLSKAVRAQIAARTGTLHSYTVFTGYKPAGIRGEMRSYEVLGDP
ncbi:MAG: hypothetical protein QOG15_2748, partial [Solirubrobacteraceae bacterium]|nr:hypothetical protein [Solirubrobacteraceae bacterium]